MSGKGYPIRFLVRGKYKRKTKEQVYVIFNLKNRKLERTRVVHKDRLKSPWDETATSLYADAVLQQCLDIEEKLDSLCCELAKCKIQKDAAGIFAIVNPK